MSTESINLNFVELSCPFSANVKQKSSITKILSIKDESFDNEQALLDYFIEIYNSNVEIEKLDDDSFTIIVSDRPDVFISVTIL